MASALASLAMALALGSADARSDDPSPGPAPAAPQSLSAFGAGPVYPSSGPAPAAPRELALGPPDVGRVDLPHRPYHSHYRRAGRILPPGPGQGWGFPNGNPDGVGWYDVGTFLPLGADRTPDYFFRRYYALPPEQLFLPSYYNAYVTRGQRYIPYSGCGGAHPAGGPPPAPADLPVHPYLESAGTGPVVPLPTFSGQVEAAPINPGGTGLIP